MGFRDNPVVFMTKRLWKYSKGNRRNVILYLILFICANAVNFLEPLVVGKILNLVQEEGIQLTNILPYLYLFIVLTFVFWIFHGPARWIECKNAFLVRANYKKYLLEGTMGLSAQWHTDHHSGDTIDKVEKATHALYEYSGRTFEVIETLVRFFSSYIALAYFNLHSSYIVFFMVIITLTIIVKFDNVLIPQQLKLYKIDNRIAAKIFDTLSNITTVIMLRMEKLLSNAIFRKIMQPFDFQMRNRKITETKWFFVTLCGSLMMFLVLASYLYFNLEAGIMVGTIYILYGYIQRIVGLFFRFAYRYGDIVKEKTAINNVEEISHEFAEKKKIKSIHLNSNWKELRIESLEFSYYGDEGEQHLEDVSMRIKRGQRIALIGESGSGKTTILKIIRELYTPRYVNLYLDGKILKNGFSAISSNITLIPQDPEIFSTTIRENITMGINHPLSYIKKYTDMACFTDVVQRLPQKLDSSIVERGVNLSGGEKQRLALARGLMACDDKSIVLLDEPTSSVDTKNEQDIYENIFKKFKKKTIISSIHRLHLLSLFDVIYFFRNGKVIASGTLRKLLYNPEFRRIWDRYHRKKVK